jgi:O-antigen/teichoic acid export membrane protein
MKKKIVKGLSFLMLAFVVFRICSYLLIPIMTNELTFEAYSEMQRTKAILGTVELIFSYGFNICVGVFLINQSKINDSNKLLWFLLGCLFGIQSIILFYLFYIAELLLAKKNEL